MKNNKVKVMSTVYPKEGETPIFNNAISLGQRIHWWKNTRGVGHFNVELYQRFCQIKYHLF